ncbi:MAG: FAD-binding oxidoreductase [bacterium]|nr:FAD-binding oxidoreductase [bacterium]MCS7309233.1 FAD-binding oxidoreductase [Armatimonadota bacterium]
METEQRTLYALDGSVPELVLFPSSWEEVSRALQVCTRHHAPGVVWGGGTQVGVGNPIRAYRWAIDMRALSQQVDYSPTDLVVTAPAGMTLGALQELLRPQQQWLPIDAPLPARQTLGGIVASNSTGPRRQRYGLPREWLLAVRAVLPSGEHIKAGVGVVKNVAGYDLPRLFAGSWGTLGVLTELTFKVAALPEVSCAYQYTLREPEELPLLRDALQHPLLSLEMLEAVYERGGGWRVVCGVAGFEEEVRWLLALLQERTHRDWTPLSPEEVDRLRDRPLLEGALCRCRLVVPPAHTAELVMTLSQRFAEAGIQAHLGVGTIHIWWDEALPEVQDLQDLRKEAHQRDGFCIIEQAPAEYKNSIGVWDMVRGGAQVMRRLKRGFDPLGVLAPGRFVEGL